MPRKRWIMFFCEKYILRNFLFCAILSASITLLIAVIGLIFHHYDPTIWLFLCVGAVAFVAWSAGCFIFVYKIKQEERESNCIFMPTDVKKVEGMLYFSNEWIIICGKTAINKNNLTKIETGKSTSRGYKFFFVAFYTENHVTPIKYSIYMGLNIGNKEYIRLRDKFRDAVKIFDCCYDENQH